MAKVSLCMIVRNEEENLPACLDSVRDLVDEMIIVDTGSTDQTQLIAQHYGARIFEFAWWDDFAAARNESIDHATGNWIFWMDADDRVDEPNRAALRELFARLGEEPVAYLMKVFAPKGKIHFELQHVRLFRNLPGIRWRWPIHEQLDAALAEQGHRIKPVPITITHTGYVDAETGRRKLERNSRILESMRAAAGGGGGGGLDIAMLCHLGRSWFGLGRYPEALEVLHEYHARAKPNEPQMRVASYYLIRTLLALERPEEAAARIPEFRKRLSDDAALCFLESTMAQDRGDLTLADSLLRHLLDPRRTWVAHDPAIIGFKARHNLGYVLRLQRKLVEAEMQWKQVVSRTPDFPTTWAALAELYIEQKRWTEVQTAIDHLAALDAGRTLAAGLSRKLAAARPPAEPATPGGARVSLCMIVRDEARNLRDCVYGVRDLVQEIIIVDTGSTDDTKEIAHSLGARVIDFPWCDDFSAARNESIKHASGDWIFWMDADDRIDEPNRATLRDLFSRVGGENAAYSMRIRSREGASDLETRHVRLFRNLPSIRWRWPIHEQLDESLRETGHEIRETGIIITHTGYTEPAALRRKLQRNAILLEKARATGFTDSTLLYYQARTYSGLERFADAVTVLRELQSRPELPEPLPRLSAGQLIRALLASGHKEESAVWIPRCRSRFPDDAELCFLESEFARQNGELKRAEGLLRSLLDPQITWNASDPGLKGFKARHNLGLVLRMQNLWEAAEREWKRVIAEKPQFETTWVALADLYFQQQRWPDVQAVIAQLAVRPAGKPLAARLQKKLDSTRPLKA